MITTSNQFIYPNRPVLPHAIHINPYPLSVEPIPLPARCDCGFYDNLYNTHVGNSFVCCNCGKTGSATVIPTTAATITTEVKGDGYERSFIFVVSLQLQSADSQRMIKLTIQRMTELGYKICCIFFNEDELYMFRFGSRLSTMVIPDLKTLSTIPFPLIPRTFDQHLFTDGILDEVFAQLPFKEVNALSRCLDGWSKTLRLIAHDVQVKGVEVVTFLNTSAKSLPSPIELQVPLHIVFPDKYQSEIYPSVLEYVRLHGGSIHVWDRFTEQIFQDSLQSLFVVRMLWWITDNEG